MRDVAEASTVGLLVDVRVSSRGEDDVLVVRLGGIGLHGVGPQVLLLLLDFELHLGDLPLGERLAGVCTCGVGQLPALEQAVSLHRAACFACCLSRCHFLY